jgi:cytochrome c oxidase subunit 2
VARLWSYFFLLMPLVTLVLFAVAPYLGWSLPENVSKLGEEIDFIYRVILFVTGTVFLGTQFFLCYVVISFGDRSGRTAQYTHGSKRAEVLWTLIPAAVIAGIAALQMPTWWKLQETPKPGEVITARVVGRRFAWEVRHAGPDRLLDTPDDVILDNELHIPPGKRVWIELTSSDVIHSFFVANMRMKQDAVPGMRITIPLDAGKTTWAFQDANAALQVTDLEDVVSLAERCKSATRPVDVLLRKSLPASLVERMSQLTDKTHDGLSPAEIMECVKSLNGLIDSGAILKATEFQQTARKETISFSAANAAKYPKVVSRRLLADAYPGIIRQLHKDYDIVCAELCGDGHYQMLGRVIVHESEANFEEWQRSMANHPSQGAGR